MSCPHPQTQLIIDPHEGTEICTACGIVISSLIGSEEIYKTNNLINTSQHYENYELLNDTLQRMLGLFSCGEQIALEVSNHYEFLKSLFPSKDSNLIAAYAIFISLCDANAPRTFAEIAEIIKIDKKMLHNIHVEYSLINNPPDECNTGQPADFVFRVCTRLNIPNNIQMKIYKYFKNQHLSPRLSGHSPSTILASGIHDICKAENVNIKLRDICQACKISSRAVYNFVKLKKSLDAKKI